MLKGTMSAFKYLKISTGMQNDRQVNYITTNKELDSNTIYIFLTKSQELYLSAA